MGRHVALAILLSTLTPTVTLVAPAVRPGRAATRVAAVAAPATTSDAKAALEEAAALPLGSRELSDEAAARAKREARLRSAEQSLDVFVVGLSHHNAKVEVREKLAIPEAEWEEAAGEIVASSSGAIAEAAVLSTCNRFEVYFAARDARAAFSAMSSYFQGRSGLPMAELRESLFMLGEEDATAHALRVSAGLDSLVVGEGQILSQMKACYAHAIEGSGGKVTSRLLNAAVAAGKRARDETDIAKGAVSISSAAYELTAERAPRDLGGLELADARVLIVGAGKMTRLLLTHMASHGSVGKKCVILNRSRPNAEAIAADYKESHDVDIEVVASDGDDQVAYDLARDADVAGRERVMLVDIAVPRNVDPACDDVDGVAAYDVDSLKAVVERNTAKRRREIVEAEKLLEEEQESFRSWVSSLGAVPAITKLQSKADAIRAAELKRADAKLANLSQREIEAVERLSRGIVSKLLHGPMSALRSDDAPEKKKNALGVLKNMFGA
ncbi:glutamyl-tRNA reductase [Aureococcus anophagefferens]|nr:glutamyl-tRNA reductase [Aureococcus anophagefferens]